MFWMILRVLGLFFVCGLIIYAFTRWAKDEEQIVDVEEAIHEAELAIKLGGDVNKQYNERALESAKEKLKKLKRGVRK